MPYFRIPKNFSIRERKSFCQRNSENCERIREKSSCSLSQQTSLLSPNRKVTIFLCAHSSFIAHLTAQNNWLFEALEIQQDCPIPWLPLSCLTSDWLLSRLSLQVCQLREQFAAKPRRLQIDSFRRCICRRDLLFPWCISQASLSTEVARPSLLSSWFQPGALSHSQSWLTWLTHLNSLEHSQRKRKASWSPNSNFHAVCEQRTFLFCSFQSNRLLL